MLLRDLLTAARHLALSRALAVSALLALAGCAHAPRPAEPAPALDVLTDDAHLFDREGLVVCAYRPQPRQLFCMSWAEWQIRLEAAENSQSAERAP